MQNQVHQNNPCNGRYGKSLDVKITNDCNCSCDFCIEKGGYRPRQTPVEKLIQVTNALRDYQTVLILGGEPFLYGDLARYLEGIDKEQVYITTSGYAFDWHPLERIANRLTGINISIHHYMEAVNANLFHRRIPFAAIKEAIDIFMAAGVSVRINTNLVKGVLRAPENINCMIQFARDMGADEIRFAELQHCKELFVSAQDVAPDLFGHLPDDPFCGGCEHLIKDATETDPFKIWVRQACGLVNSNRPAPASPVRKGSETKVLYPDGTVYDSWVIPSGNKQMNPGSGCHDAGCHGRRRGRNGC